MTSKMHIGLQRPHRKNRNSALL